VIQALSMVLFYIPGNLAAGGVSGVAQIIGSFTGWPVGTLYIALNRAVVASRLEVSRREALPGAHDFRRDHLLDRHRLARQSAADRNGVTRDPVLNALYGGVVGGLRRRVGSACPGHDWRDRYPRPVVEKWRGIPLSHTYVATDVLVVFAAGLSFGWDLALYAVLALYISGVATEFAAEGVRIARTAVIISTKPQAADKIMADLERA
jgi:hypothetical protein